MAYKIINSQNSIDVYEINGAKILQGHKNQQIIISNHWNLKEMVVIEINSKKYTIIAEAIKRSVDNATNGLM